MLPKKWRDAVAAKRGTIKLPLMEADARNYSPEALRSKAVSMEVKSKSPTTVSLATALHEGTAILKDAGISDSRREAGTLLQHVISRDRTFIIAHPETPLTPTEFEALLAFAKRRAAGEPLQYITQRQEFFGLEFEVTKDVLIPRPETEMIIETVLELLPNVEESSSLCDVGTGSGCIAITLLHQLPMARALAVDISSASLEVAKRNASRHSVLARLTLVASDCLASVSPNDCSFDLIASNPPYISDSELEVLQREVREHEPRAALSGGADGLNIVRRLLSESGIFLKQGGHLLIEIGFQQASKVEQMIDSRIWTLREIRNDLQGIPRLVVLKKSAS